MASRAPACPQSARPGTLRARSNSPFLPRSGGRGGRVGRSGMDVVEPESGGRPQPPPGFLGGGGRVVLARRGRCCSRHTPPRAPGPCATFIPSPACGRGCEPKRAGEGPTTLLTSHELPAILCAPSQPSRHTTVTTSQSGVDDGWRGLYFIRLSPERAVSGSGG